MISRKFVTSEETCRGLYRSLHPSHTLRTQPFSAYALHGVRASPIVCQMQDTVFKLSAHGMKCAALSGDMNKEQRQNTMRRFQQGEYRALVVRCAFVIFGVDIGKGKGHKCSRLHALTREPAAIAV